MNIETLLHKEIESELKCLKDLEAGTEEYKATVDGVTKLMDRAIEMEKIGVEENKKSEDRKYRWIDYGIAIAGMMIPPILTVWGTKKSFEFEKEGTITTIMGRGFINKLLPKK